MKSNQEPCPIQPKNRAPFNCEDNYIKKVAVNGTG